MRKKELLEYINAKIVVEKAYKDFKIQRNDWFNNRDTQLGDYIANFVPEERENELGDVTKVISWDEKELIPNIPDIKEDLEIIRIEIQNVLREVAKARKIIKDYKCNHEIRLTQYGFGTLHHCVFCGKMICGENTRNWEESKYRNSYCVNLDDCNQPDWDSGLSDGYKEADVFEIIKEIINDKDDDEDIDLVKEFSKLDLKRCEVKMEETKNEQRVLIVGGTNKKHLDEGSYITTKVSNIAEEIAKEFLGVIDMKVLLIDNEGNFAISHHDYDGLKTQVYDSSTSLEGLLRYYSENSKFDLIVDTSDLRSFIIKNGDVVVKKIEINFSKYFPSTKVVRVHDLSDLDKSTIEKTVKSGEYVLSYLFDKDNEYYVEDDNVFSEKREKGFSRIRKEIKK